MSIDHKPPEAWGPFLRLAHFATRPLERFLQVQAASGIALLAVAACALVWANSPWADSYFSLWHTPIRLEIGQLRFEHPLEWFVNDGLMVVFFFVVGLEIRRELSHGELSELKRALLPAGAALGGMLAPALLYLALAGGSATRAGWGVPTATDIAFAVGVLALLGKRVPPALRVLLLALAVIDDLGAIVVIGLFYSAGIQGDGLAVAFVGVLGILVLQRFGVRHKAAYVAVGLVVWGGIAVAGVHPTIAGVIVGLLTPVRAWLGPGGFLVSLQREIETLSSASLTSHEFAGRLRQLDAARREALSPAESLIELLHPWVAFGIMPIFALANAGVRLGGVELTPDSTRITFGVFAGLVFGKPLGVLVVCWLMLKLRVASLPVGLNTRHLVVLGSVAGIGFTMALFVARLAFTDALHLAAAKVGVLAATAAAAVAGLSMGRLLLSQSQADAAATADEAERSTTH
ncbi:MAG: Na+/H+ antiporter NhaA [Archangium sp.]|nr:Na+/H+ antiporter NhaA [Archangium sp.]